MSYSDKYFFLIVYYVNRSIFLILSLLDITKININLEDIDKDKQNNLTTYLFMYIFLLLKHNIY